jgi:hypothetical protein
MDQYQELLKALGKADDVEYLFTGARGSKYASHKDASTTGFRIPSDRKNQTAPELQPKSNKTLFMSERDAGNLKGWVDNEALGTRLEPLIVDGKFAGLKVISTENLDFPSYGKIPARSYKVGQTLATIPASIIPQEGLLPIELGGRGFESPIGTRAVESRRIHIGNPITEVVPKSNWAGKAGIAAALAGGAGAASAGDFRRAAGDVVESFLPLGITPSTLAPGTLTPEQRAASDAATQRKRQQEKAAKMKAQSLLRTGVPMPDEYRRGGRVRMI